MKQISTPENNNPKSHSALAESLFPNERKQQKELLFFLSSIDAPEELQSIKDVCLILLGILPMVSKIAADDLPKQLTDLWGNFCKKIIERTEFTQDSVSTESQTVKKKNPLHGLYSENPIYCALAASPKTTDPEIIHKHTHLKAHLLYAHICLSRHRQQTGKSFRSSTDSAARAVRILPKEARDTVRKFPPPVIDHESYHQEIEKIKLNPLLDDSNFVRLSALERFFAFSLELRSGRKERERERKKRIKEIPAKFEILHDTSESEDTSPPPTAIYRHSNIDEKEANDALKEGLDPDENYSGPIVTAGITFATGNTQKAIGAAALKIKNQHRYLACANQMLPPSWAKLNFPEIVRFWEALILLVQNEQQDQSTPVEHLELAALLAAMYWTSSGIARALSIKVCVSAHNLPSKIDNDTPIYFCLNEKCWVVPRPEVPNRKSAKPSWKNLVEPNYPNLFLPVSILCYKFLKPWLDIQTSQLGTRPIPLFKMHEEKVMEKAKELLKMAGKKIPTRLTVARISSHLVHYLADITGDIAIATYIFGRVPPGSQRTSLYYYAPSRSHLQKIYTTTCEDIEKSISESTNGEETYKPIPINQEGRIGSAICPRSETVALLVQDMLAMIDYRRKNRLSESFLVEFHNVYVSYCLLMLGFMTGYRSVRDPLHDESNIDWDTGFIVISDKDDDHNYNSRITWVPPVCLQQLKEYKLHRYRLIERITLKNGSLANALKIQKEQEDRFNWGRKRKATDRSEATNHKKEHSPPPFFFYLTTNFLPKGVGVTNLRDKIHWSYSLPLNANRHYLRTKLAEECVSGEIIDAYMGHWDRGREPFGRFSTLSPDEFRKQLEEPLISIGNDAGWKVIKGLS